MNVYPYTPGASQPRTAGCADCGSPLFASGNCPNLLCPSNTPTEPTMRALAELEAEMAVRAPDPNCPMCCGTGRAVGLPFCWNCG